jgi:F0F1-type ATP synthase membrane subunit b/b'
MLQTSFTPAHHHGFSSIVKHQPHSDLEISNSPETPRDIFAQIDLLEEKIIDNPRVPLTGKTMVNENELIEQIDAIRFNIPTLLKTAQEIIDNRDILLLEAQQQAENIVNEAHKRAYQIANELGIINRAEQEARHIRQMAIAEGENIKQQAMAEVEQMRQAAKTECQEIQTGADEYADRVLQQMETQLNSAIEIIHRGRQNLQG